MSHFISVWRSFFFTAIASIFLVMLISFLVFRICFSDVSENFDHLWKFFELFIVFWYILCMNCYVAALSSNCEKLCLSEILVNVEAKKPSKYNFVKLSIGHCSGIRCGNINSWVSYGFETRLHYDSEKLRSFKGVKNAVWFIQKWSSTGKSKNARL